MPEKSKKVHKHFKKLGRKFLNVMSCGMSEERKRNNNFLPDDISKKKEKGKLNDNGLDNFSKISKEKLLEKVLFESSETVSSCGSLIFVFVYSWHIFWCSCFLSYDGQCCKKIWIENVHNSSESLLMLASFWVIVWQKEKWKILLAVTFETTKLFC